MILGRRTTTMLSETKVAILLALNIQVQPDRDRCITSIPLLVLTGLFFHLLSIKQRAREWRKEIRDLGAALTDLVEAVGLAFSVFWNVTEIIGKSLWFGIAI